MTREMGLSIRSVKILSAVVLLACASSCSIQHYVLVVNERGSAVTIVYTLGECGSECGYMALLSEPLVGSARRFKRVDRYRMPSLGAVEHKASAGEVVIRLADGEAAMVGKNLSAESAAISMADALLRIETVQGTREYTGLEIPAAFRQINMNISVLKLQ